MQSVSSRMRTRIVVPISYDDNHYTTGTSKLSYYLLWYVYTKRKKKKKKGTKPWARSILNTNSKKETFNQFCLTPFSRDNFSKLLTVLHIRILISRSYLTSTVLEIHQFSPHFIHDQLNFLATSQGWNLRRLRILQEVQHYSRKGVSKVF